MQNRIHFEAMCKDHENLFEFDDSFVSIQHCEDTLASSFRYLLQSSDCDCQLTISVLVSLHGLISISIDEGDKPFNF